MILYSPQGVARAGGIDANIGGDPVEISATRIRPAPRKRFSLASNWSPGRRPE
jgi:hypothetical protein